MEENRTGGGEICYIFIRVIQIRSDGDSNSSSCSSSGEEIDWEVVGRNIGKWRINRIRMYRSWQSVKCRKWRKRMDMECEEDMRLRLAEQARCNATY